MVLSSNRISSKLVWESLEKLNNLDKENKAALCWVPAHTRINRNEKANLLTRKAPTNLLV